MIIISLILISPSTVSIEMMSSQNSYKSITSEKTYESIQQNMINIDSNSQLKKFVEKENLTGEGTIENPFRLKNYTINSFRKSHSMYIRNTDLHFVIEDCQLVNSSSIGLELNNVSNLTLKESSIVNATTGLRIEGSSDNRFLNNEFKDIEGSGITLIGSSKDNKFYENKLWNCSLSLKGKSVRAESDEITENNTVNGAPLLYYRGTGERKITGPAGQIILVNSKDISIESQGLKGGTIGLQVFESRNITIDNLTIKDQNSAGINTKFSKNISITDSEIIGNFKGISVENSNSIEIDDNNISKNKKGIELLYSYNNSITSNRIISNDEKGVELKAPVSSTSDRSLSSVPYPTKNNTVSKNIIRDSGGYGIYVSGVTFQNRIFLNIIEQNRAEDEISNQPHLVQAFEDQQEDIPPNYWHSRNNLGNYWGNWTGSDENNDGIIDMVYMIKNSNSSDDYPLSSIIGPPKNIRLSPGDRISKLEWDKPRYSILDGVKKINIYRGMENENISIYKTLNGTRRSFIDNNLTNGNTYHYRLQATKDNCSSVLTPSQTVIPDGTSPTILSYDPRGEEVPVDSSITIEFSEFMRAGSVNITVEGMSGELEANGRKYTLDLNGNLSYGKKYKVIVKGKDLAKNNLEGGKFVWSFRTISKGSLVGKVVGEDGSTLEGVTISIGKEIMNYTDEKGKFEMEISPGKREIVLSKSGYESKNLKVEIKSGETNRIGEVKLEKMEGEESRVFWPMAMVGAIIGVLGIISVLVFFKNWRTEEEAVSEEEPRINPSKG